MNRLAVVLCVLALFLSGCTSNLMLTKATINMGGKDITYVAARSGNSLLDHAMVIDRYGPDGTLLAHDSMSNNGILEQLGGQALQTLVPAYTAFEAVGK
jgi:hypothetical protein